MNKKELRENIAMAYRMLKPALEATNSPEFTKNREKAMLRSSILANYFRVTDLLIEQIERESK